MAPRIIPERPTNLNMYLHPLYLMSKSDNDAKAPPTYIPDDSIALAVDLLSGGK